ncbi:hypothetical protein BJ875DRAFT_439685 [Amylocarpus encephaloides]|uniref:Glycoside hydrolase 131 catalytic N-terminal domain-containing protein n=1 Tax=Amylocarpus encephaloides TaxID=45428 RepID=A0A9P7YMU8_9HELO|nr:hypothetical protein BJ875DRAFT_439685 [Amylocarpus encephaloides]
MQLSSLLPLFLLTPSISAIRPSPNPINCPLVLDGRIRNASLSTFDTPSSPFDSKYVKGLNLTWSQILLLPPIKPSRFSSLSHGPIEVTIDNHSLFLSGGKNLQHGFRRAELILGNGSDASNSGIKTFHWSVKLDAQRALNLSHEYMLVWHESGDYSHNQWSLNLGVMLSQDRPLDTNISTVDLDKKLWKVLDGRNNVIWTHEPSSRGWMNFAVVMDGVNNTLQIFYSSGDDELVAVTEPMKNDNSGMGQFHIGVLKKPTETESVVWDGYQEPLEDRGEGLVYSGVFVEDSEDGCVSR